MNSGFGKFIVTLLLFSMLSACTVVTPTPTVASPTTTPFPQMTSTSIPASPASTTAPLPPSRSVENWKDWPILPVVSANARAIYEHGLQLGTNPNRFSVLGDCQSEPNVFMARYDDDTALVAQLPQNLQETIQHFSGSFRQTDPTVWPGTTFAAVLGDWWVDPVFNYCKENETPLDCVLRVRNPSIVLINLGTHYEARNDIYLQQILQELIDRGVLPVLAFKADNREGDDRLNQEIAQAAIQFDLPVWNFYRAASALPDNGLKQSPDAKNIYLTDEGLELHRFSALQALDSVWRQLTGK
jgi:hypothetical protein